MLASVLRVLAMIFTVARLIAVLRFCASDRTIQEPPATSPAPIIVQRSIMSSSKTATSSAPSSSSSSSSSSDDSNIYFYKPSLAAAAIFASLYFILVIFHLYLSLIYPRVKTPTYKHRYTINLFIAAVISTFGFGVRIASVNDTSNVGLYATSATLIVVSPIFVCASLYLFLKHFIRFYFKSLAEQKAVLFGIDPKWLGRIFISSDVFSFLLQGSGSGIAASGNWEGSTKDAGINVLITGLAMQLVTITLFLALTIRMVRMIGGYSVVGPGGLSKVLLGAWIGGACVEIRSIYRLVEFGMGINGYPFMHEWCLYVLEALQIFIALTVLGWYHPIRFLQPERQSRFSAKGSQREVIANV